MVDTNLNLNVAKACVTSSWSSLDYSVESKELSTDSTTSPDSVNGVSISSRRRRRVTEATSHARNSRATITTGSDTLSLVSTGYFSQKRTLKKPERVPSIYKLKLRPRVHPRHYRLGRKPTWIPTPISYRGSRRDTHIDKQHTHLTTTGRQTGLHGKVSELQAAWLRGHSEAKAVPNA